MRFYKTCDGKCGRKHLPQTAAQTKLVEHIKTNYINDKGKYTICLTYMLNGKCKCDKNNPQYNYQQRHIYWKKIRQNMNNLNKKGKWREQVDKVVERVQPATPERDSFNMPMMDALRAEINELKQLTIRLIAFSETKTSNDKTNTMSIRTEKEMVVTATQTELVAPIDTETETVETQTESIDEGTPPGPPDVSLPTQETPTTINHTEPAAINKNKKIEPAATKTTLQEMHANFRNLMSKENKELIELMDFNSMRILRDEVENVKLAASALYDAIYFIEQKTFFW